MAMFSFLVYQVPHLRTYTALTIFKDHLWLWIDILQVTHTLVLV